MIKAGEGGGGLGANLLLYNIWASLYLSFFKCSLEPALDSYVVSSQPDVSISYRGIWHEGEKISIIWSLENKLSREFIKTTRYFKQYLKKFQKNVTVCKKRWFFLPICVFFRLFWSCSLQCSTRILLCVFYWALIYLRKMENYPIFLLTLVDSLATGPGLAVSAPPPDNNHTPTLILKK